MEKDSKRFWSKVQVKESDECWPWTAAVNDRNYGRFRIWDTHVGAHRIAYWLTYGTFPYDKTIRHTCDNPSCCNPAHLIESTSADNMRDMADKNRGRNGRRPNAKFYANEIWLIRRLRVILWSKSGYVRYKFSSGLLSKMFKTTPRTIINIWNSERHFCKEGYYV